MGLWDIAGKVLDVTVFASKHARVEALKKTREENDGCLHILNATNLQVGDPDFSDEHNDRDINPKVGTYFSCRGYTHFHPDPRFAPNTRVEWLVRSQWGAGGADAQNDSSPVVSATGIGYTGFFWRSLAGDRGGGYGKLGYCPVCSKDPMTH